MSQSIVRPQSAARPFKRKWLFIGMATAIGVAGLYSVTHDSSIREVIPALLPKKSLLTKEKVAEKIGDSAAFYKFPTDMEFELDWDVTGSPHEPALNSQKVKAVIEYAFDPKLQAEMEGLFETYRPDYGAFVAMDARTGQVLSMVSYSTKKGQHGNLALRATFPSASVFKVVTAAAAIEGKKYSADTIIPYNGSNHTLYRSNVLKTKYTRWTRYISLRTAFAKSVNTVFGKIGAFTVGPEELRTYADRFGFNRKIASDIPFEEGKAPIPDDPWSRAETASGYTQQNTMSPLQGALIAAAIANDGVMMEPYIVRSVFTTDGGEVYTAQPQISNTAVDRQTAQELRELMKETVTHGTSSKSFRGFFKGGFHDVYVGGKTGSLTGTNPPGKHDWFVGFADDGSRRIAVAALTIHDKYWRVKSSYLARRAFEHYLRKSK